MACRTLVPWPGIKPLPPRPPSPPAVYLQWACPQWKRGVLNAGPPGKSPRYCFISLHFKTLISTNLGCSKIHTKKVKYNGITERSGFLAVSPWRGGQGMLLVLCSYYRWAGVTSRRAGAACSDVGKQEAPRGFLKSASMSKPQSTGKEGAVIQIWRTHTLLQKVLPFASWKKCWILYFQRKKKWRNTEEWEPREN